VWVVGAYQISKKLIVDLNKPLAYHSKHREEHEPIYKNHLVLDDLELKQADPPRKQTHQCQSFLF
jgi:hypothetical protein